MKVPSCKKLLIMFALVLYAASFFVTRFSFAAPVPWIPPASPPPLMSGVSSVFDVSDLVNLGDAQLQSLISGLQVAASGSFPGYLSYENSDGSFKAGLVGTGIASAGVNYEPLDPKLNSRIGVYGFGEGGDANFGVYAVTATGTALWARSEKVAGFAGFFEGGVSIEDNDLSGSALTRGRLTVSRSLEVDGDALINKPGGIALNFSAGQAANTTGVTATTTTGIAIHAHSSAQDGIAANSVEDETSVNGLSLAHYGAYGYSGVGAGFIGEAASGIKKGQGVYGESRDYGLYANSVYTLNGNAFQLGAGSGATVSAESGVGIFACGTKYAATFKGNVTVARSLNMGVRTTLYVETGNDRIIGRITTPQASLDAAKLQQLIDRCRNDDVC